MAALQAAGIAPGHTYLEDNMGKKIAGFLGAMVTLGALNAAEAAPIPNPAPADVLKANSFADLLDPIPNAAALLRVVDESAPASTADENIQLAQYHHHHHHHHHHRRRHHHHHHHHHY
jgi:hypothetical protein